MNLILWAVPAVVVLLVFVSMARRLPWMESNLGPARVGRFSGAAGAQAARRAASREAQAAEFRVPASSWSDSSAAAEQGFDPLSRENLARLCGKFHIREISLLPSTRHAGDRAEANLRILVDFEPQARMDYSVFFRLSNDLFTLVGRRVDLVCKNTAELEGKPEVFAQARVLYAA